MAHKPLFDCFTPLLYCFTCLKQPCIHCPQIYTQCVLKGVLVFFFLKLPGRQCFSKNHLPWLPCKVFILLKKKTPGKTLVCCRFILQHYNIAHTEETNRKLINNLKREEIYTPLLSKLSCSSGCLALMEQKHEVSAWYSLEKSWLSVGLSTLLVSDFVSSSVITLCANALK